jgi:hypothetical protein
MPIRARRSRCARTAIAREVRRCVRGRARIQWTTGSCCDGGTASAATVEKLADFARAGDVPDQACAAVGDRFA